MIKAGFFISFEGIDCSGKSTQLELLHEYLSSKLSKEHNKVPIIKTKEPGGTELGNKLRDLLLNTNYQFKAKFTELLLFIADRLEHIEQVIKPNLDKKAIVLCDRFLDSTIAYQIGGRDLPESKVLEINTLIDLKPDLTFLIDIDPDSTIWQERFSDKAKKIGKDRFEKEDAFFYQKVRQTYLKLAKKEPARIIVLDGLKSIKEINLEIINIISEHLLKLKND